MDNVAARLVLRYGKTDKPEYQLTNRPVTLGREAINDVVLSDPEISRRHARLFVQDGQFFLEDLGSTNGTFLNGERIHGPMQLRDGDQIKVGDVVFTFRDPEVTTQETAVPELEVDVLAGVVRVNRQLVTLAPKEFDLLTYLFARRGEVCTKDDIGTAVWPEYQSGVYDYQIENLVRRLRTRLEADPAAPQLLLTIRGRGYKLTL